MAFEILVSHLSDHIRSLAEDPSVSGRWPHARSAPAKARAAQGLIADGEVGGVEAATGLELRVEAALEDAADQKGSLDRIGGPARLDHGLDLVHQTGRVGDIGNRRQQELALERLAHAAHPGGEVENRPAPRRASGASHGFRRRGVWGVWGQTEFQVNLKLGLTPRRQDAVERVKALPPKADEKMRELMLCQAAGPGMTFYNTSRFVFQPTEAAQGKKYVSLLSDQEQIAANLTNFIAGFSANAREIFLDKFKFGDQINRLEGANLLYLVLSKFTEIDLHPDVVDNIEMGYIFEELIRRFSEASNETAGDHFTPREVIRLMVNLLFFDDSEALTKRGVIRTLYDFAAGTRGMLAVTQNYLREFNRNAEGLRAGTQPRVLRHLHERHAHQGRGRHKHQVHWLERVILGFHLDPPSVRVLFHEHEGTTAEDRARGLTALGPSDLRRRDRVEAQAGRLPPMICRFNLVSSIRLQRASSSIVVDDPPLREPDPSRMCEQAPVGRDQRLGLSGLEAKDPRPAQRDREASRVNLGPMKRNGGVGHASI